MERFSKGTARRWASCNARSRRRDGSNESKPAPYAKWMRSRYSRGSRLALIVRNVLPVSCAHGSCSPRRAQRCWPGCSSSAEAGRQFVSRRVRLGHMSLQAPGDLHAFVGEAEQAQAAVAGVALACHPSTLLHLLDQPADAALFQRQRVAQLLLRERRTLGKDAKGVDLGERERPARQELLRLVRAHLAEDIHQELVERSLFHASHCRTLGLH